MKDILFASKPCLRHHVEAILSNKSQYCEALETTMKKGVFDNFSQATKGTILATLHLTGNTKTITPSLLSHFDVVAIVKACEILDRPRFIKQEQQRIASIEQAHPHLIVSIDEEKVSKSKEQVSRRRKGRHNSRPPPEEEGEQKEVAKRNRSRKIDVYRAKVKNARSLMQASLSSPTTTAHDKSAAIEIVESASLSGAFARKIRRWANTLDKAFLEFIVMSNSFEYWKRLADWVHFSPKDFRLAYFLSAVHGMAIPEDSFVFGMRSLLTDPDIQADRFKKFVENFPQVYDSYNFLRTENRLLRTSEIALLLAQNVPLSTAIWYLEEIAQAEPRVPAVVADRLKTEHWMDESSKVTGSFGKLLERILTFSDNGWDEVAKQLMPAAERRLGALKEKWAESGYDQDQGITVVCVDKSGSMYTAIKAGSIIGAMISTCFQAELSFFDHRPVDSPHKRPGTVSDVMDIVRSIDANNGTSMAAGLWPYFQKKQKIARFILVSDEGENSSFQGYMFGALLKKYKQEVHDEVEMISICVDSGSSSFRESLVRNSIESQRIEIDGCRPDLSKFDSLLGQIALMSRKKPANQQVPVDTAEKDSEIGHDFLMVEG